MIGKYCDQLISEDGSYSYPEWRDNKITLSGAEVLAAVMSQDIEGIVYHAIGGGQDAWDIGGVPAPDKSLTKLERETFRKKVDGVFFVEDLQATAGSGDEQTIVFAAATFSQPDGFFNGLVAKVTAGTNVGESAVIQTWTNTIQTLTFTAASFTSPIDATSVIVIEDSPTNTNTDALVIKTTYASSEFPSFADIREQGLFGIFKSKLLEKPETGNLPINILRGSVQVELPVSLFSALSVGEFIALIKDISGEDQFEFHKVIAKDVGNLATMEFPVESDYSIADTVRRFQKVVDDPPYITKQVGLILSNASIASTTIFLAQVVFDVVSVGDWLHLINNTTSEHEYREILSKSTTDTSVVLTHPTTFAYNTPGDNADGASLNQGKMIDVIRHSVKALNGASGLIRRIKLDFAANIV